MSEWGKHYGSMYEGSMVGKGAIVFALMGFIIARMQCRWVGEGRAKTVVEGTIRLNPQVLAAIFGESAEKIEEGIKILTSPDPKTNLPDEEGRRLIPFGPFDYRVVNAAHYQNRKDKEEEREKTRERVAAWREEQAANDNHGKEESSTGNNAPAARLKPTMEEVKLLAAKLGLPVEEAEKFHAYYESNGWKVGKNTMKSVNGAMAGWKMRYEDNQRSNKTGGRPGGRGFDRNAGTFNAGKTERYDTAKIQAARELREQQSREGKVAGGDSAVCGQS